MVRPLAAIMDKPGAAYTCPFPFNHVPAVSRWYAWTFMVFGVECCAINESRLYRMHSGSQYRRFFLLITDIMTVRVQTRSRGRTFEKSLWRRHPRQRCAPISTLNQDVTLMEGKNNPKHIEYHLITFTGERTNTALLVQLLTYSIAVFKTFLKLSYVLSNMFYKIKKNNET